MKPIQRLFGKLSNKFAFSASMKKNYGIFSIPSFTLHVLWGI